MKTPKNEPHRMSTSKHNETMCGLYLKFCQTQTHQIQIYVAFF